jgi:hypothetical protein
LKLSDKELVEKYEKILSRELQGYSETDENCPLQSRGVVQMSVELNWTDYLKESDSRALI